MQFQRDIFETFSRYRWKVIQPLFFFDVKSNPAIHRGVLRRIIGMTREIKARSSIGRVRASRFSIY